MARQHDVACLGIQARQEIQHQRVGGSLVQEPLAAGRGEGSLVERVGAAPERIQVVRLATRQTGDELVQGVAGDEGVVGSLLHRSVIAEVGEGGNEMRLRRRKDGAVGTQHAGQQGRARARGADQKDQSILHHPISIPQAEASRSRAASP
jgi:hypothetical protein